uniref:AMP-dependent synthetase/ligase domain-containing protein n=1 Tax=Anopheles maculatus TaxID=74869 RepID=A0A182TBA4_9DIPT
MTYEMTNRMARGLLSQKGCAMRKNDVLGLLLPNIPEFVPALHGGLLAGLSVTFANPLYTAEEVCRQFENAGVTAIVTLPMLLPVAEMFRSKVKQYKGTICIGGKHDLDKNIYGFEQFLKENHRSELPEIDCHKTAILPYSSGTTGLPKGVELSHYNLVANLAQGSHPSISKYYQPEYIDKKETILTIPPYFHIYGLNAILHSVLKSKNHIVSIPRYLWHFRILLHSQLNAQVLPKTVTPYLLVILLFLYKFLSNSVNSFTSHFHLTVLLYDEKHFRKSSLNFKLAKHTHAPPERTTFFEKPFSTEPHIVNAFCITKGIDNYPLRSAEG